MMLSTEQRADAPPDDRPAWDAVHLDTLVRLVGVNEMTSKFGYLLRHYWFPATRLEYMTTRRQQTPRMRDIETSRRWTQEMLRCDTDSCTWRERVIESRGNFHGLLQFSPPKKREEICVYDRARQTFRRHTTTNFEWQPENDADARDQAILSLPLLTPLLPLPLGFTWHVRNELNHLEFTLEALERVDNMPVLLIRRRGEVRLDQFFRSGNAYPHRFRLYREGVTLYALDRGVILQDRTYDVVRSENSLSDYDGMETWTTRTLLKSSLPESPSPLAPLMFHYETRKGKRYLYDGGTGRILEMGKDEAILADDYRVLTRQELFAKHAAIGETRLETAYEHFEQARQDGYFADHQPSQLSLVDRVAYDGQLHEIGGFWRQNAMLLILGLTERCNLDCAYCCYSGKFAGQRTHSAKSMSLETAKAAITHYLENGHVGDGTAPITFYGGEPLLEFHLLQECVRFAEELATKRGEKVRFAITTNGTLLDDTTVDYLVDHEFLVMVSMDGPQPAHDRYRVFPNQQGTFTVVERNLRRFAERYPDYKLRGINCTLAPPFDLETTDRFIAQWVSDYPMTRASLVNPGAEYRFRDGTESPTQYGCHSASACEKTVGKTVDDSFRAFGDDERGHMKNLWNETIRCITEFGVTEAKRRMPLGMLLCEQQIGTYHRRTVTKESPELYFFIPCFPGFTRRFVDVDGNYRVCERVDHSEAFVLGNVRDGLDEAKMKRTMEFRRHCGDCANCMALRTCDVCYVRISESDAQEKGFDPQFDLQCQRTRQGMKTFIQTYTEIMEANPKAFDRPFLEDARQFKPLRFGGTGTRTDEAMLKELREETT